MNEFFENWKTDSRYQAKVKLILYGIFILIVTIGAVALYDDEDEVDEEKHKINSVIEIPNKYTYTITINIDDKKYKYSGKKDEIGRTIIKETDEDIKNYIYQNDKYYIENDEEYTEISEEEVYDNVKYSYINMDNITKYLEIGNESGNQYLVYLKDIKSDLESEDYIVINVNNNKINIDYTPLARLDNENIIKYTVAVNFEKIG